MRCPFCGKNFDPTTAGAACKNCSMFGGCKKIKCPHCGYESPAEPKWITWLKKKLGRKHD